MGIDLVTQLSSGIEVRAAAPEESAPSFATDGSAPAEPA
jgi:hypothetical protein